MDIGGLRALVRNLNFATHGVPAVVTIPDGDPVETRIIWLNPEQQPVPDGADFRRLEGRRAIAVRSDEVPVVPRGTRVAVTEHLKDSPDLWVVDAPAEVFSDHVRVVVIPDAIPT